MATLILTAGLALRAQNVSVRDNQFVVGSGQRIWMNGVNTPGTSGMILAAILTAIGGIIILKY